ncbi:MAG: methylated-DNA--[Clostridia bacterium]|nr:methylated-DNA--[protein]-cysteine S-methyltransferase [Clostridia bacterium]
MHYIDKYLSPIGAITIASNGQALTGLWFDGQKYFADTLEKECEERYLPIFEQTKMWLDIYFSGKEPDFAPQLKLYASYFRMKVWDILKSIPFGSTITYGEIAKQIAENTGKKVSAQAVGGAVGHNPISIIVPCHRVVGANDNLTGYAGGVDKKIYLLQLEGIDIFSLWIPEKGNTK